MMSDPLQKLVVATAVVTTGLGALALGYFVATIDTDTSGPGVVIVPSTPQGPAPRELPTTTLDGANDYLAVRASERPLLLLVLDADCVACMENMQNWQSLAREFGSPANATIQTIILSISPHAETVSYLDANPVPHATVHLVERWVLAALSVTGTPTTLGFTPTTGELTQWLGVLSERDKEDIRSWAAEVNAGPAAAGAREAP